ncbi:MAG: hypothetical protein JWP89_1029 [Schlesneria sp.]|nr:hypothetical protein [Schlesneria sp.]
MIDLWHRWQRDVKADRQKAVLLAALLLLGCCFWIPMLAKAMTPKRASAATSQAAAAAKDPSVTPEQKESSGAGSDQFWSSLANSLANDPLFQAAEVNKLERDPFGTNESWDPLPVLFAEDVSPKPEDIRPVIEEPTPTVELTPKEELKVAVVARGTRPLQLTSTMISRSRRAAMINGQFISVGREIQSNGQSYLLTQVESHRVLLTMGDETIELKIARSQLKAVLDPRNSDDPRE